MNKLLLKEVKEILIKEYASKYGSEALYVIKKSVKRTKAKLKVMKLLNNANSAEELIISSLVIIVLEHIRILSICGFKNDISTEELFDKLSITKLIEPSTCNKVKYLIKTYSPNTFIVDEEDEHYNYSNIIVPVILIDELKNVIELILKIQENDKKEIPELLFKFNDIKHQIEFFNITNIDIIILNEIQNISKNNKYNIMNKSFIIDDEVIDIKKLLLDISDGDLKVFQEASNADNLKFGH